MYKSHNSLIFAKKRTVVSCRTGNWCSNKTHTYCKLGTFNNLNWTLQAKSSRLIVKRQLVLVWQWLSVKARQWSIQGLMKIICYHFAIPDCLTLWIAELWTLRKWSIKYLLFSNVLLQIWHFKSVEVKRPLSFFFGGSATSTCWDFTTTGDSALSISGICALSDVTVSPSGRLSVKFDGLMKFSIWRFPSPWSSDASWAFSMVGGGKQSASWNGFPEL